MDWHIWVFVVGPVLFGVLLFTGSEFEQEREWTLGVRQALGRKRKAVAVEPELDFSGKQARREAERQAWARDFLAALGESRGEFVREWADGSRRQVLAKALSAAEYQAFKDGRDGDFHAINRLRHELTENPEQAFPERRLREIEGYLVRVEEERQKRMLMSYAAQPWRF